MTSISIYHNVTDIIFEMPSPDSVRMILLEKPIEYVSGKTVNNIFEYSSTVARTRWLIDEATEIVSGSKNDVVVTFSLPDFKQTLGEFDTGRARTFRSKCIRAMHEYVTMGRLIVS